MPDSMPFNLDRVEVALREQIPQIGVLWREETTSTNQDARELARLGAKAWTVIVAGHQSEGRGRYDRPWASPPGGLYQSLLLRIPNPSSPLTLLPLLAGVALKDAIEGEVVRAGAGPFQGWLKWPNDLLTPRGKLAGILCEATQQSDHWEIIIGCGLNLKPVEPPSRKESRDKPITSLGTEHPGVLWRRENLLISYLLQIKRWLAIWEANPEELRQAWLDASGVEGHRIEATSSGRVIRGTARGINEHGALIVDTDDGTITVNAAEALIVHAALKY